MQLKYVGPKPLISHTGIDFDNNKDDKYAYLNIAVQLLKALDHDYFEEKTYTYNADTKRLSETELLSELQNYCDDLDKIMEETASHEEQEVLHQLHRADENETLSSEDKEVLKNNINLMKNYLIQREVNRAVYYCIVGKIAEVVKKDHIDYIVVPMFQKFAHVLHSVQGVLREQKFPIDMKLDIYEEDGKLFAKLQTINILDEV